MFDSFLMEISFLMKIKAATESTYQKLLDSALKCLRSDQNVKICYLYHFKFLISDFRLDISCSNREEFGSRKSEKKRLPHFPTLL